MSRTSFILTTLSLSASMLVGVAHAGPVVSTSAASFVTPQNVNGNFTLNGLANVQDSTTISHVEITQRGRPSAGLDYYRFTHGGGTVHLDMDGPTNFDMEIGLWTLAGALVANSDDNGGDPGSTSFFDSAIFGLTLAAGDYVVGVCAFNCAFGNSGSMPGSQVPTGGAYVLNISSGNAGTVPEPTSAALVLLALAGTAATRRRKASQL